eukprot:383408_1
MSTHSTVEDTISLNPWNFNIPQYSLVIGYIRNIENKMENIISSDIYQLCLHFVLFNCRFCSKFLHFDKQQYKLELLRNSMSVCEQNECQQLASQFCNKFMKCGHRCISLKGQKCLNNSCCFSSNFADIDNEISCWHWDSNQKIPIIQLESCGHYVHLKCVQSKLDYYYLDIIALNSKKVWKSFDRKSLKDSMFDCIYCPNENCNATIKHQLLTKKLQTMKSILKKAKKLRSKLFISKLKGNQMFGNIEAMNKDKYGFNTFEMFYCNKCTDVYVTEIPNHDNCKCKMCMCFPVSHSYHKGCCLHEKNNRADYSDGCQASNTMNTTGYDSCGDCIIHGADNMTWKCFYCCRIATSYQGKNACCSYCSDSRFSETNVKDTKQVLSDLWLLDNKVEVRIKWNVSWSDDKVSCTNANECPLGIDHPENATINFQFCYKCWTNNMQTKNVTLLLEIKPMNERNSSTQFQNTSTNEIINT